VSVRTERRRRPELNLIRLVPNGPAPGDGRPPDLDLLRLDKIEEARSRVANGFYSRPEVRRAVAEILAEMLRD
jgi:hypothetical protein